MWNLGGMERGGCCYISQFKTIIYASDTHIEYTCRYAMRLFYRICFTKLVFAKYKIKMWQIQSQFLGLFTHKVSKKEETTEKCELFSVQQKHNVQYISFRLKKNKISCLKTYKKDKMMIINIPVQERFMCGYSLKQQQNM